MIALNPDMLLATLLAQATSIVRGAAGAGPVGRGSTT
jgi:hypothetical protein